MRASQETRGAVFGQRADSAQFSTTEISKQVECNIFIHISGFCHILILNLTIRMMVTLKKEVPISGIRSRTTEELPVRRRRAAPEAPRMEGDHRSLVPRIPPHQDEQGRFGRIYLQLASHSGASAAAGFPGAPRPAGPLDGIGGLGGRPAVGLELWQWQGIRRWGARHGPAGVHAP